MRGLRRPLARRAQPVMKPAGWRCDRQLYLGTILYAVTRRFTSRRFAGSMRREGADQSPNRRREVRPKMVKALARFTNEVGLHFDDSYGRVLRWTNRNHKNPHLKYVAPGLS